MITEYPSVPEMVQELDGMDRDVTSYEADFLDHLIDLLKLGSRALSLKEKRKLHEIYDKYLGDGASAEPEETVED